VWIVENGRLAKRDVVAGMRDDLQDLVEVKTGLAGGEVVVIGAEEGLEAGLAVETQNTGATVPGGKPAAAKANAAAGGK
jgi:hypothetical protein